MNWFKNLKIKSKLIICFVIIAIFTGIIGGIGIINMNKLNALRDDMRENNYLPAQDLEKIQTALEEVRSNHLIVVYEEDPTKFNSRKEIIDQRVAESNIMLDRYKVTIKSQEEQQMFDDLMESLVNYRNVRNENLAMIEGQNYDEAMAVLHNVTSAREHVSEDLQNLIDYKANSVNTSIEENNSSYRRLLIIMIAIIVLSVLVAIGLGIMIANIISKPLSILVNSAKKVANKDLDVEIDINTKDEVGILAKAFETMVENMNDLMSNIRAAAEQVASGSKQVSESSMELSQGATEQASSIEELTASIEEISSQTRQNAENANEANELAENAKANAMQGDTQMKEMLKAMNEINESSASISKIIKVIDEIAFQTNILALNAAVEAARAGQHGKGFAVVAEEVRNLAARSANAAKETTTMIEGSIKKVEGGTKIANETADALNKIVEGISKAATLVGDIAVASNEQATGIAQVNEGINQVSQVVQTNSATSEEGAAASEELSSQSKLLNDMVREFNLRKNKKQKFKSVEGEINPDVLKMLDNMAKNKKTNINIDDYTDEEVAVTKQKTKIDLSDKEFGKY